jgi:hypothetical protein
MQHEKLTQAEKKYWRLLIVSVVSILCLSQAVLAQSGRRQRKNPSSTPPVVTENKTEAEAKPKPPASKPAPLATVIVGGDRFGTSMYLLSGYVDVAVRACIDRLSDSTGLEVVAGGGMTRSMAIERAKKESNAYVLWLEVRVEEDNSDTVSISYYGYTPQTAKVMTSGRVYLGSRGVGRGGVGIGVPSITGRLPLDYQMREAGKSVADRVRNKFGVRTRDLTDEH